MRQLLSSQSSAAYFVKSIFAAMALLAFAPADAASAGTLKTLHSFCNATNCADGNNPHAGLVMDDSGNLYGTTEQGGKYNSGLVFKLIPNAKKTKYTEHILKNFCAKTNCSDGGFPQTGLIMDTDGNLYGTTGGGGKYGGGAIFKMRPLANGWAYSVIHSFCRQANCTDGDEPTAGLAYAGQAAGAFWNSTTPLFGTTYVGGSNNRGVVYKLSFNGSGWAYQTIHSFSSGFHGGELMLDSSGNLIGTTLLGGTNSGGTIFRLASGSWSESTLYAFCAQTNCTDGAQPVGRLALDGSGNLFGTASVGGAGAHCIAVNGCGVAFELTANGKYKVIDDFCSLAACKDGEIPSAGVVLVNAAGDLAGTTYEGGTGPGGTVFTLHHGSKWTETVIYNFCSAQNCTDGAGPVAPLIVDPQGNFYGTDAAGGANGDYGTVFEVKP
jgi:uncharacterized repeat protein (TIGR03803 family)